MRRLVVLLAIFLTHCDGVKSTLGLDHQGPNEFDSVPLSPLSLPPDFEKTPATKKSEERKTKPKAFPFVFAEPGNEAQEFREEEEKTQPVDMPSSDQAPAQNILLGTPSKKETNLSSDLPSKNGDASREKTDQKKRPQKSGASSSDEKVPEATVDVQAGEAMPLPLPRAVSRPILNSPHEEETIEERPTKWADQEAVLNNSWLSVQEGTPLQEAELHILDGEVTDLGEGAKDSTQEKRNPAQANHSMPKKEFDAQAAKRSPTAPLITHSQNHGGQEKSHPFQLGQKDEKAVFRPRGMSPILKEPNQRQVRKKAQVSVQDQSQRPSQQTLSAQSVATHTVRHPDPSPTKTSMKPILSKRAKTRTTGARNAIKRKKRSPRRIVRRRVPHKVVPLPHPTVPNGLPVQQSR